MAVKGESIDYFCQVQFAGHKPFRWTAYETMPTNFSGWIVANPNCFSQVAKLQNHQPTADHLFNRQQSVCVSQPSERPASQ
jgi:hypothetical protein